jgi:group 4 capsule polysaccharide lipoprotein GfcB/YjbF
VSNRNKTACLLAAAALALAGCSSDSSGGGNGSEWGQIVDMVSGGGTPDTVSLEQASAVPYATIGVRVNDEPQMMLVLAADEAGDHLWTSKARAAVTTRYGRVVRTSGLPVNIDGVNYNGEDPVQTVARSGQATESMRTSDFWDLNRFSIPLRCVTESRGADHVTILGKSIATVRVDQTCESPSIDWSFTDSFWVGTSGLVWKSIQHYHPNAAPIEIEVLRPPVRTN